MKLTPEQKEIVIGYCQRGDGKSLINYLESLERNNEEAVVSEQKKSA